MITGSPFKEILKVIDRDVFWLREMTVADSEICSKTICSKKAQTAMDLGLEDGRRGDGPVVGVLTGLLAAAALQRRDALLAGGGGGGGGGCRDIGFRPIADFLSRPWRSVSHPLPC